jgi:hypothetical protein
VSPLGVISYRTYFLKQNYISSFSEKTINVD